MGLFNFVKGIGKKLFVREAEASEASDKIKQHIAADNPGIKDLDVSFENGVATIKGDAKDSAAIEKAILMAGNVEGVTDVNIEEVTGAKPDDSVEYYEIQSGDSLWKVADKFYGNGSLYTKIVEANKEVIIDADKIYPGQKIRIPKK